jgi:biopolymer transport protein TolR
LQSGIEVDLPKTTTVKEITEAHIVVTIDHTQRLYIGSDEVNIHDLGAKARAQMRDPAREPVYLRSDETVPFGQVAMVLDNLKQGGIANVLIVTEPLSERTKPR